MAGHWATVENGPAYLRTTLVNVCPTWHRGHEREQARIQAATAGAYVWARPGPDGCLGGLFGSESFPCEPTGWDEGEMATIANLNQTVVGGAVPPGVEQVQVETFTGETVDAELVDTGGPFHQRFFLTLIGVARATDVVARAANGTELHRTAVEVEA